MRSVAMAALAAIFCAAVPAVAQFVGEPIDLKPVAVSSSGRPIDIGSVPGVINTIRGLTRRGSGRARLSREDNLVINMLLEESRRDNLGLTRQQIFIGDRDLNNDGRAEVIVALIAPLFAAGGDNGFETRVYSMEAAPREILSFNANTIAVDCSSRSDGFCDVVLNGDARVRYETGTYVPTALGRRGVNRR